ncbi:nucleoside hydrolase-like domain-containing protein [Ideonella sp. YS5]|uniref:nucleoside hydrolase-like domain-containing protein n=1 Tax=Ideonella sp. YS5 TaxID=3453714 RepID=UPI003EECAC57
MSRADRRRATPVRDGLRAFAACLGTWLSVLCLSGAALGASVAEAPPPKPRLIVLTDIENEPDDTQSLVRLLLYANDIELRGLVATTSVHMRQGIHAESIRRVIQRYAQVLPQLRRHDPAYPDANQLLTRVAEGQAGYGLQAIGEGRETPGSELLLRELRRPDRRPLWVSVWGGANTLAQALHSLRRTSSRQALAEAVARLRVYAISDQDDTGAWLRREFPDLFYIVSPGGYGNATWGAIHRVVEGVDNTQISNAWIASHIQQGHGPLGAAYPDVAYGMEGDTPSFLGLIPNGLNAPEHPDWGGWGGRYELYTPRREDTDPQGFNGGVPIEPETRPIWTNAVDRYRPHVPAAYGRPVRPGEREFSDAGVTLWRWREAIQNDFAARMLWTTRPPAEANHAPVVQLAHEAELHLRSGDWVTLDVTPSTDPDGDSLSFLWFAYPEAGTLKAPLSIGTENLARVRFQVPGTETPATAHVIVQVNDKGTPALTRYRRVLLHIEPLAR